MAEPGFDSQEKPHEIPPYLVTFTDTVSLVLTFFVMLFAMSNVQVERWKEMVDTLSQALNPARQATISVPTEQFNIASVFRKRAINLDYLMAVLEENMVDDPLLARSRLTRLEDRLVISLPGDLLFDPGSALLSEKARQALFDLGGVLRNIANQIIVSGHTDPQPTRGGEYASNWELSMARAVAVSNALRRSGYLQEITALGYADARLLDLPPMPTEERYALARRVDLAIMPNIAGD
jgi:chemotaxis protein MotB